MDHDAYLATVAELYAAEVLGEGLASRWLELSRTSEQQYKLGLFLQLDMSRSAKKRRPMSYCRCCSFRWLVHPCQQIKRSMRHETQCGECRLHFNFPGCKFAIH